MATHHNVGAAAPGQVTPAESDDARELDGSAGTKGLAQQVSLDCRAAAPWPQGSRATALLLGLLLMVWLLDSGRPR